MTHGNLLKALEILMKYPETRDSKIVTRASEIYLVMPHTLTEEDLCALEALGFQYYKPLNGLLALT